MDNSETVKKAVMQQVLAETNVANAQKLIDKLQDNCFEKCIPKPGTSLSAGEKTCMTQCFEKYMAAWNQVNATYIARLRQENNLSS